MLLSILMEELYEFRVTDSLAFSHLEYSFRWNQHFVNRSSIDTIETLDRRYVEDMVRDTGAQLGLILS